ncbi:Protein CBG07145 [Caenorhabditis briggsae]|uniref:RBR-type E3 ubiquitin transferase n=1 Tax=Caenorhabditis briggsae TaxID=6238 RepID=A8X3L7_CAEBR|nr:Protein CBG07145 [Caenorhabditis briggsae]CAP27227.2 Protein CBG07145 [Caenorhabditis briggsae]
MDSDGSDEMMYDDNREMEEEDDSDTESEEKDEKSDEFQILNPAALDSTMTTSISGVVETLEIPSGTARILLQKFKWNNDILMDKFYESTDVESLLKVHKIESSESQGASETGDCDICCDTGTLTGMSCGHVACYECWKMFIMEQVKEGHSEIQCMASKCELLMPDEKVLGYLEDSEPLKSMILNNYVQTNVFLKWCPGPNCENAVKSDYCNPHLVTCTCGTRFCFSCCDDFHNPINCRQMKLWLKKCSESGENAKWIIQNTKDCPKCLTSIEKNGGCNYMRCTKPACGYQFCWICMDSWEVHKHAWYKCSSFDKSKDTNRKEYRSNHDRYLFFYNRFRIHVESVKLEKKLVAKVEKLMDKMQQRSIPWAEVRFLPAAVDTLSNCRRTLTYTYVFAFYLNSNNHSIMFENNQKDLEMATEQLSGFLERDMEKVDDLKALNRDVQDKCRYVEHRRKVLLDHCSEGVEQGIWNFIEE